MTTMDIIDEFDEVMFHLGSLMEFLAYVNAYWLLYHLILYSQLMEVVWKFAMQQFCLSEADLVFTWMGDCLRFRRKGQDVNIVFVLALYMPPFWQVKQDSKQWWAAQS